MTKGFAGRLARKRRREGIIRHYRHLEIRFGMIAPLIVGAGAFLFLFCSSIFVYMRLEGWTFVESLYMATITLSTVGFQEVRPLSTAGRLFTCALIFVGVGTFMFMAGSIAQLLAEGKFQKAWGRRRVTRAIAKLKGHCIMCGFGRIGTVVVREMLAEGVPVVVIENDPSALEHLEEEGLLHIAGDATQDDILTAAGLANAASLITSLNQEAANVYVTLTARQLNPALFIVARADSESHIHRLELAGANRVILPHTIGGLRMAQSVIRPEVTSFLELALQGGIDLQLEELKVSPNSELIDKDLVQSQIRPRFNLIIVGIKRHSGELVFNPSPGEIIGVNDTLLAIGKKENLNQLQAIL